VAIQLRVLRNMTCYLKDAQKYEKLVDAAMKLFWAENANTQPLTFKQINIKLALQKIGCRKILCLE